MNKSPFLTGRYASLKYGIKKVFVKSPVIPSIVSWIGRTWILVKLGTYPAGLIWTTSPNLTLRFFLTTLFILIFPSSSLLSISATTKVYFLFFPLIKIASPLNIFSSLILACDNWTDEFSSFWASSTWIKIELPIICLALFSDRESLWKHPFLAPWIWIYIIGFKKFLNYKNDFFYLSDLHRRGILKIILFFMLHSSLREMYIDRVIMI